MGTVQINGGWDNLVDNNVFIDCPTALNVSARWQSDNLKLELEGYIRSEGLWSVRLGKAIQYNVPPYSLRYPELAGFFEKDLTLPSGNRFTHNVFYRVNTPLLKRGTLKVVEDKNFQTNDNFSFVDIVNMNFQFKKNHDFKEIPFDRMGLCKDEYRISLPPRKL